MFLLLPCFKKKVSNVIELLREFEREIKVRNKRRKRKRER